MDNFYFSGLNRGLTDRGDQKNDVIENLSNYIMKVDSINSVDKIQN